VFGMFALEIAVISVSKNWKGENGLISLMSREYSLQTQRDFQK
jgi:hypothetical protein